MSFATRSDVPANGTSENGTTRSTALVYVDGRACATSIRPPATRRIRGTGTTAFDPVSSRSRTRDLSFQALEIGVPPIPLVPADVETLRESISLVGQITPVLVRELADGRLVLLDGWGRVEALRSIERTTVAATILSGLSDQEARLRQIVSNQRKKLSALDRAREDYEFLQIVREKVSLSATPVGGRQPAEKCHAKAANELKVFPDRIARSELIARILPEAQAKARELNLHDNQSALLKIAAAGDTAELQIMKAIELSSRPKAKRSRQLVAAPTQSVGATVATAISSPATKGNGAEMPDIPAFLRRDRPEISSDQIAAPAGSEPDDEGQGGADQSDAPERDENNAVKAGTQIQFGLPPNLRAKLEGLADSTPIQIIGFVRAQAGEQPRIEVQDITELSGSTSSRKTRATGQNKFVPNLG